ncbi:hypothetical protein BH11PAT1_BH11PAT1_3470 [soil metagenome]
MLKTVLTNVLVVLFVLVIVFVATVYADAIKKKAFDLLHIQTSKVLGVRVIGETIDPRIKQQEVSKQVQGFVDYQTEVAKKGLLNIKISDVLNTVNQSQKILHDLQTTAEYVHNQAIELQKKLPHNNEKN